jgi:hypothetical protein
LVALFHSLACCRSDSIGSVANQPINAFGCGGMDNRLPGMFIHYRKITGKQMARLC